ncbi:MAG: glycosyltransferase family 2 protein, partial [Acidimicrobiales bacterium]
MPEEHAPPVVAVVVASDSGPWLEETLSSLAAQDYDNLTTIVVDAGSERSLAPRVAKVTPTFYFARSDENRGYGPSANAVLDLAEGAAYYLFCHDDVVLEPDTVRRLVEEAFRSNAGLVGPKLVDPDEPDRILQLGLDMDRFGAPVRRVERREFDQSQHDEAREVFAVPGGCLLVRADLFETIGGFDDEISMFGEDIDLAWRARIAGARVSITPLATVRHLEATAARRRPMPEARALQWRHELRAVLKNYSTTRRWRVVTQLVVLSTLELGYFVAIGRSRRAREVVDAWRWNYARERHLHEARAEVAAA